MGYLGRNLVLLKARTGNITCSRVYVENAQRKKERKKEACDDKCYRIHVRLIVPIRSETINGDFFLK